MSGAGVGQILSLFVASHQIRPRCHKVSVVITEDKMLQVCITKYCKKLFHI